MKVLNLRCSHQHSFEGWFGSEQDFQDQLQRSLIECPLCTDKQIHKLPSAPRLNLGAHLEPAGGAEGFNQTSIPASHSARPFGTALMGSADALPSGLPAAEQAAFLKALRHVVTHTEDVGERFAEEARRMHYGESEARNIRGQTSTRQAVELLEEGIAVLPLPMLPALKETLQ